jgi:DNA-binding Xre family transcriptional regulator
MLHKYGNELTDYYLLCIMIRSTFGQMTQRCDIAEGVRRMHVDGGLLRRARIRRALSQAELADTAGINRMTVSRLELGRGEAVQAATLRKLAGALDVEPGDLIDWAAEEIREKPAERGDRV